MKTKSGNSLHPIGIGTYGFGGEWGALSHANESAEKAALQYSLEHGQNHIDTAELYGRGWAEKVIGKVTKAWPRHDLYIASKLWREHSALGQVRPAVEAMLGRLQTDYLDMLYIHMPWEDIDWTLAVPQIGKLIDEGIVRHFGVSNCLVRHMEQAAAKSHHPITANQIYYNYLHKDCAPPSLVKYCGDHKIKIVAYTPLAKGEIVDDPLAKGLAEKYQATPSQISLAWLIAKGTLPIPKAGKIKHIEENLGALKIELQPSDIEQLDKV